ncbi:hypothetical protein [Niabella sp.]|uniref:hypothetical protein n=1 Tax=Niabella sp. TaxID=1962976 RepID=UPI002614A287|nr:hypothetical protein [Niabella sp.]
MASLWDFSESMVAADSLIVAAALFLHTLSMIKSAANLRLLTKQDDMHITLQGLAYREAVCYNNDIPLGFFRWLPQIR